MNGDAIGALAVLMLFGGPVAAWIIHRSLSHAEYMAMIRNGVTPPDPRMARRAARGAWSAPPPPSAPPPAGVWGAPPPVAPPVAAYNDYNAYYAQRQLHRGLVTGFVGLAILIGLTLGLGRGPWMLGGLIPMFVGIAQVITAVLAGAQINLPQGVVAGHTTFGPQTGEAPPSGFGPPPGPPPPPPTPDSYGGWRPGSIPSIEKPASPPDQR